MTSDEVDSGENPVNDEQPFMDDNEYAYTTEMCRRYIVPNWYLPEHFDEMEGWSEARIDGFKEYLTKVVCAYDSVKQFVREVIHSFEQDYPEGDSEDASED